MEGGFVLFIISIALCVLSVIVFKKSKHDLKSSISYGLLLFVSIFFYLLYYIADYLSGDGISDSVIFHLKTNLSGIGYFDFYKLIISLVIFLVFLIIFFYIFLIKTNKKEVRKKKKLIYISLFLIFVSLIVNPTTSGLYKFANPENPIDSESFYEELLNSNKTDFGKYYVIPSINGTKKPKNLVFIYAEGLEYTFFNETLFPNLTKNLNKIKLNSTYFTNIDQVNPAHYTIGGIVASQCGIPLYSPSHGNSLVGSDQFLPLATCFGDLLSEENYNLAFYGGADLDFAGKGLFFKTHNFLEVKGKDELIEENNIKDFSGWGIRDDELLEIVHSRFLELSETNEKFALFTLTLDTHHPNGHLPKSCENVSYGDGKNPILNSVACTDILISELLNKIKNSEYSNNTIIVLASDHLMMKNTATKLLNKGKRRNSLFIIDPENREEQMVDKYGTTLDTGTTVLSYLGYEGSIGLGRDLNDKTYNSTEAKYIKENIINWKKYILFFWNYPKIEKSIYIDIEKKYILLDDRHFLFPIMIELDDEFRTSLKFEFFLPKKRGLENEITKNNGGGTFIIVDYCVDYKMLNLSFSKDDYCLIFGRGKNITYSEVIQNNLVFNLNDIKERLK